MSDSHGLSKREIKLIEELGILRRTISIHKLIETCLIARLGGECKVTHGEMEHTRKQYILQENIQVENYMADIHMRVRLRSAEDDYNDMRRENE